ncbi:hypothetical protein LTS18_013169, partial [Coniosporium uncinatum]
MAQRNSNALSTFIESAPPGELSNVTAAIKNIASDEPNVLESLAPAFQKYNEEQFTTVKLPGGSQSVWKTDAKHKSLLKSLSQHTHEHYPSSSLGVYSTENDSKIAVVVVANKYSPNNFWNGRYRALYLLSPSSGSLTGSIKVDVHYYEDGNVRLLTDKPVSTSVSANPSASDVTRSIAQLERKWQEEINRAFGNLSEGAFKGLRRQLPVTRQKI